MLEKGASMDDATLFGRHSRTGSGAADAGETVRSIAEALQISPSCVTKWKNLRRGTGGLSPGKIDKLFVFKPDELKSLNIVTAAATPATGLATAKTLPGGRN